MVQWLRPHTFNAEGEGSIPSQGPKIPHDLGHSQKKNMPLQTGAVLDEACLSLPPTPYNAPTICNSAPEHPIHPSHLHRATLGRDPHLAISYPGQESCPRGCFLWARPSH